MVYVFDDWQKIRQGLRSRYLFLFLDCDGTLAPIADTPAKAAVPRQTKRILRLLSAKQDCRVAVISGRDLAGLKKMVGLKEIIYSGNHGFQISGPKIKYELALPDGYGKMLRDIKSRLKEGLSGIKGALVEDKKLFLTLHFRLVDDRQVSFVNDVFHQTVAGYAQKNKIKVKSGKKVFEIGPCVRWDKGKVVLWLLARQQFGCGAKSVLPLYIGDDATDEDAFKALKGKGLTIFVGEPGYSAADYYLKDTQEVMRFLKLLADLKSDCLCRN